MNTPFVFFGTSRLSVIFCEEIKNKYGMLPAVVVTTPDRPVGRKQVMTAPLMKRWAEENNVKVLQPEKLKDEDFAKSIKDYKLFVVASYGKIIPQSILDIPSFGTINIHPSLLPKYRGASPIQNQIINSEKNVGTTIMLMDALMDHGDIIVQKDNIFKAGEFPDTYTKVEEKLTIESAHLFASVIQKWINGEIKTAPQDHDQATFTKIIDKSEGEIDINGNDFENYLKYLAFIEWPKVFFFTETPEGRKRNIVTEAEYKDNKFIIKKIIPEGKKETNFNY